MFTPEEVRQAVLIAFMCGTVVGACVSYVWLAIVQEARATQRIPDLSEAASALGKRGRAKQLATIAEKRAQTLAELRQWGTAGLGAPNALSVSQAERYGYANKHLGSQGPK